MCSLTPAILSLSCIFHNSMALSSVILKVDVIEGVSTLLASSMRVIQSHQSVTQLLIESCEKSGIVLEDVDSCRAYICTPSDHSNPVLVDKECWDQPVVTLINAIGANCIRFKVTRCVVDTAPLNSSCASENVRIRNAFSVMMVPDPGVSLPKPVDSVVSGKDNLFNALLKHLQHQGIGFRRDEVGDGSAKKWLRQITDALFFVEPYRKVFKDRGRALPVSPVAGQYNNPRAHGHTIKRLDSAKLRGHMDNLSRFVGPGAFMSKRKPWKPIAEIVEKMIICFEGQVNEMRKTTMSVQRAHSSMIPIRTTADCVDLDSVEVCEKYPQAFENECKLVEKSLEEAGMSIHVKAIEKVL